MSSRRMLPAAGAVLALLVAGCTGSSSTSGGDATARLLASSRLEPCPSVTGAAVAGTALPDTVTGCLGRGPRVRLATLRGPLVLNVWGSWCPPCQAETPVLQGFHALAGSRVPVLGLDISDDRGSALGFAAHAGMTYPSVVDDDDRTRGFRSTSPPETFLVDASGRVVHRVEGPLLNVGALRDLVAHYLGVRL